MAQVIANARNCIKDKCIYIEHFYSVVCFQYKKKNMHKRGISTSTCKVG